VEACDDGNNDNNDGCSADCQNEGPDLIWVFANYDGPATRFDPGTQYNGTISCAVTCNHIQRTAVGVRYVCNSWNNRTQESCSPANHNQWAPDMCANYIDNGVYRDVGHGQCGNSEQTLRQCLNGNCSEGYTWHALSCQCRR
jgi:hypothetical protein